MCGLIDLCGLVETEERLERPVQSGFISGYLFWSDVGSLPKIERSTLTGSSRKIIVSQGIAYPIALDVDIQSSKLYWVDSYRNSVERSNLDGTEREMIKRLVLSTFLDIQVFSVHHCASSPCENICVSESTRPVCLCAEGFALNSDGRTCSATTGSLHRALVWATTTTLCAADIRGIHNEREYITSNKTCFSNVGSNINWITVDSHDRKIIFADGSDIFAMTLDGVHTKKRITSATETVTGLAVDWGDKNVYWCQGQQSGTGKINVFSQTTTNIQTLISSGLDNPKALNMIPLLSTMIWINGRLGSYQIKKAHVHGTDIQTIVSFMDLFEPRDLTVDAASQRLYFIDGNSFKSVQLDGSELTEVYVWVAYTIRPLKLHSYKNNLLVADDGFNIDVVPLTGTGSASLRTLVSVTDICVVDINEQPKENGVYRAHPDRLALDYSTGNIYYTAVKTSQLPASFTGIGVVSPNGHHRKLISGGVYPRAVEIDPSKGWVNIYKHYRTQDIKIVDFFAKPTYLFWTDYGTTPAVLKRAHTDGTKIVTLFTSMKWPNGIAIDRSASALYVTDGYTNIIYRCGYEVNTCDQYFKDPESHLMDIKLLGNYLYYTAWNKVYITKLHKTNSSDIAKFANNAELGRLDSISLYSSTFLPTNIQSQCSSNNGRGNCSTFCHPTPNSFTCGCPDGEQVHLDGKTCRSVSCPMREMQEDRKVFTFSATRIGERGYSWERCYPCKGFKL
ncbi:low-density lipoprotein receptor-related protein 6-like [Dreissena polymorpha]|uniref:low-density lipoprotein receptor-related protein 6-like n=1 Tax=Dreissena polymorpha TaxID=45954 RepID=UPI00226466B3|nr:low-density lipoprotein receptor-related protein 6-like [Dreissena polymorpha]